MRRLGCLTPFGIVTGVLALATVGIIIFFTGGTMFSPGKLSAQSRKSTPLGGVASHAAIGGNCEACHAAPTGTKTMDTLCLDCHTDIQTERTNPSSLHGALQDVQSCRSCHTEHKGENASLTSASLNNFPHSTVGFALDAHVKTAAGQPFTCADCHTALNQKPLLAGAYRFDANYCVDCHINYQADFVATHTTDFGTKCMDCHDGVDRYTNFDHNTLTFPLDGKHVEVKCNGCHNQVRQVADFKRAPSTCVGCHQLDDVHQGAFGADCVGCHNTTNWQDATFDHSQTAFPLTGGHITVKCADCHVNKVYKGTPTDCVSCHADPEVHKGQFGTDCASCHTTTDWKDVTTFDHMRTKFPLTGAHTAVKCADCHVNNVFKGTPTTCISCHTDPHKGQFGTDCNSCHSTGSWKGATFKHNFPLNHGGEGTIPCATCHTDPNNYKSYTCYNCHAHNEAQTIRDHRGEASGADLNNCVRCHPRGR